MRLFVLTALLAVCACAPAAVYAQAPAAPPATATPAPGSDFAAPPGANVTLDIDARDGDLLGMVKDLLSGMSGMSGKNAPPSGKMSFLGPMSGVPFDAILKNVTHLRLIQYQKAGLKAVVTPIGGEDVAPPAGGVRRDPPGVGAAIGADPFRMYEQQFAALGARRLLYSAQGARVLIMGFDTPHAMAFVTEDAKNVTVGRIDGMVNLKPVSAMIFGMMGAGETMEAAPAVTAPAPKPAPKPRPAAKPRSAPRSL